MADATGPPRTDGSPNISTKSQLFHFRSQRVQSQCVLMTFSHHKQHSRPIALQDLAVAVWPHLLRSGSMRQCGPALVPLVCVDVQRTLLVDCSVGVNNEGFTYAGIWEQTGFREIHMAYTGLLSQVSLFWSNGGQGSPAVMSLRTHSLEQVVFLTWGLSVGPSEPSKPCCRAWHGLFLSMLTAMPSLIHSCSLPWMRHPAQQ